MHLLKDKVAVVTGGTSGIGRAIASAYAIQGASVIVLGTHLERGIESVQMLEQQRQFPQQQFITKSVDVANKGLVDATLGEIIEVFAAIDILVNCAGVTRDRLLMKMSQEDWDRVIAVNLTSVYNTCQFVVRPMVKARSGVIINVTSVIGLIGNGGQTNYAASKAGIIGFTKACAKEVAGRNIRVNCIAPGFIQTPMTEQLTDLQTAEILKRVPLGRLGLPEEVAHLAVFLASPWSGYVTGQTFAVDGGMVM